MVVAPTPTVVEAREPPEARGMARDEVRLLAAHGDGRLVHTRFRGLRDLLAPSDLLVVNTSATLPAALAAVDARGSVVVLHLSTRLPGALWLTEPRRPVAGGATEPWGREAVGRTLALPGGARAELLTPWNRSEPRLWFTALSLPEPLVPYLSRHGRAIRYGYVDRDWPLSTYQTVFARQPGSAEMPSAARPFTAALVTDLVALGIGVTPLVLHTGVSSPEAYESPYPEQYHVPAATARRVNETRAAGGRVIAVGTTVVRALETRGG